MKVPYYLRDQLTPEEDARRKRSYVLIVLASGVIPPMLMLGALAAILFAPGFVEWLRALGGGGTAILTAAGIALGLGVLGLASGFIGIWAVERYKPASLRSKPVNALAKQFQEWAKERGLKLSKNQAIAFMDTAVFKPEGWQPFRTHLADGGSTLFLDISPEGEFGLFKLSQRVA